MTDDEEFSNFFLQDLKNQGASAENVLKKVQDMIDDKSIPYNYIKSYKDSEKGWTYIIKSMIGIRFVKALL